MLKKILFGSTILVIISLLVLAGCAKKETYGAVIDTDIHLTMISDILAHPEQHTGREVVLHGKITMECGSGCWFFLDDETAQIYVDLNPAGLAIPQYVGKKVKVIGKILQVDERIVVNASGLEF